jgi:hypothetical protein
MPVAHCGPADLFDPAPELSANSYKPRVVHTSEPGHIHVVAADPDRNIARKNRRIFGHNLCQNVSILK